MKQTINGADRDPGVSGSSEKTVVAICISWAVVSAVSSPHSRLSHRVSAAASTLRACMESFADVLSRCHHPDAVNAFVHLLSMPAPAPALTSDLHFPPPSSNVTIRALRCLAIHIDRCSAGPMPLGYSSFGDNLRRNV